MGGGGSGIRTEGAALPQLIRLRGLGEPGLEAHPSGHLPLEAFCLPVLLLIGVGQGLMLEGVLLKGRIPI